MKRSDVKRLIQRTAWARLNVIYVVEPTTTVFAVVPGHPCELVPVDLGNCARVCEFREQERIREYQEKVRRGEVGYYAVSSGHVIGSVWATINTTDRTVGVRGYIRLQPREALIHDIVTAPTHRGLSVGAFMTSSAIRLIRQRCSGFRILLDVRRWNTASHVMMRKVGLTAGATVLYVSILGRPVAAIRMLKHGA